MYIRLSTGPIHDSGKDPVMVMFSREELAKFKSLPESDDIFISYPDDWDNKKKNQWIDQSRDMIKATLKSAQAAAARESRPAESPNPPKTPEVPKLVADNVVMQLPTPPPPTGESTVVSDDALLAFLDKGELKKESAAKTAAVEMEASFEVVDEPKNEEKPSEESEEK